MSNAYYPIKSSRPRRPRENSKPENLSYFEQALECLAQQPERIEIIKANLVYYQAQEHLPKSAKAAIKRFEYLLAVTEDPKEIANWVLEDSYEGQKFRQLPLLLKGLCDG